MSRPKEAKPAKPYASFPLTAHPSGTWCKKINGRLVHFGPWSDPMGARERMEAKLPDLRAAREQPAADISSPLVRDLAERWLVIKLADANAGRAVWSHYAACRRSIRSLLASIGDAATIDELTPDHFGKFASDLKASVRSTVRIVSSFFTYADDEDWIDRPVKLGRRFRSFANQHSDIQPEAARTPDDFRKIIKAIDAKIAALKGGRERDLASAIQLRAGVWLAVNGGYGSADLSELPRAVIDMDAGVIDYRRGKTRMERVVPLMRETIAALKPVLATRPDDDLVFRTREGNPWKMEAPKCDGDGDVVGSTTIDNWAQAYGKLLRQIGMKRPGKSFYELKYLHSELADGAGDVHAAMRIVGHALPYSRDPYVRVTEDRLRRVVDFVRSHLISSRSGSGRSKKKQASASSRSAATKRASRAARKR